MDVEKSMNTTPNQTAVPEISVQPLLCALSDRYASRGIVKAVQKDALEQQEREEQNRELAPDAYRLSLLTDEARKVRYCHGEDADMTASDLVSYFDETRAMRLQNADFSVEELPLEDEEEQMRTVASCTKASEKHTPAELKKLPGELLDTVKTKLPKWFDTRSADTSSNKRTFPLSAFAAVAAVAASLMLIVASSVMVTQAEGRVSALQDEIDSISVEVADLDADFNVRHDLLRIRQIAMSEYGMVSEQYVRMEYLSLSDGESVETFGEDEEESVGLAALLSAIGVQKQN